MSTPYLLLGLLSSGAQHGYELKRSHDSRLPFARPLAFGQVYATLGRLERDGWIAQVGQDQDGGPERTSYELTGPGRVALHHWLSEVEPPMPHVASALMVKVLVALLAADEATARAYLGRQRAAHSDRVRELTQVKLADPVAIGAVVAADYAIAHLDADLRWLETTLARVAELNREVRG